MKAWSLYDIATGFFSRKQFSGPDEWRPSVPSGMALIEGSFDHLAQRVDIESGKVVDYQPPSPDDDHEWIVDRKRWVKLEAVAKWEAQIVGARAELERIDARTTRAFREKEIDPDAKGADGKTARERILDLEAQAELQRAIVNAPKPVTEPPAPVEPVPQAR